MRVTFPRTAVLVSGSRAPEGRVMDTIGAFEDFEVDGVDMSGPARLAYNWSP